MPWNFPFWQVLRFACAALAAGNAALLKHSPDVTGCALAIEELFADAGAPAGLFRALVVAAEDVPAVSPRVVEDPRVAAVTLTGSERAGSSIAAVAGAAIKKTVLELGGSDPFVVLADADVAAAAAAAVEVALRQRRPELRVRQAVHRRTRTSPTSSSSGSSSGSRCCGRRPDRPGHHHRADGPRRPARRPRCAQVEASRRRGCRLVAGGAAPSTARAATSSRRCSTDVAPGHDRLRRGDLRPGRRDRPRPRRRPRGRAGQRHDVRPRRLGVGRARRTRSAVGRRIRSGALFVNAMVASDPRLPFGGIGRSGYGRELSAEGVREFTNVRTVVVA